MISLITLTIFLPLNSTPQSQQWFTKGKNRPVHQHKSHRLVRVSFLLGRLINEHVRPEFIRMTRPRQSPVQYGYTAGISYLLAALQRHEIEKYCLDNKKTFLFFGCSLDGVSAFEMVNREIQKGELFFA